VVVPETTQVQAKYDLLVSFHGPVSPDSSFPRVKN